MMTEDDWKLLITMFVVVTSSATFVYFLMFIAIWLIAY